MGVVCHSNCVCSRIQWSRIAIHLHEKCFTAVSVEMGGSELDSTCVYVCVCGLCVYELKVDSGLG